MDIFSEIYGAYYRAMEKILACSRVTKKDIEDIFHEEAFAESFFEAEKKLTAREGGWGLLLENADGSFSPITKHIPPKIVTELQKRWLKAKLADPKMRLFLDDDTLGRLDRRLELTKPLYSCELFRKHDVFSDGDPYSDEKYIKNFRMVMNAVLRKEQLEISYKSPRKGTTTGKYLPIKLEYSEKNDKFRVYCLNLSINSRRLMLINIGRIIDVHSVGVITEDYPDIGEMLAERRCTEPAVLEVSGERNGVERFMLEFAGYEKRTELDAKTGRCKVRLWYDLSDETELLIRILGFGPVIRIIAPKSLRERARERIERQTDLLSDRSRISENNE